MHQMLIVFPLGLMGGSAVFDLLYRATGQAQFAIVAFYLIGAGLLAGFAAAPFGAWDWLAIPVGTRAKSIGLMHAMGNVVVLLLFVASWWLRRRAPVEPTVAAQLLSIGGALLTLVTGWLGGELVDRLGVGISDGAHLDAPSSLHASVPKR
ncbi:MAG: DUF2231 domain-containing protein [Burkholderiaceae bacterium]